MQKFLNFENEWGDSVDAIKVEGAVRRIEVEEVLRVQWIVWKLGKQGSPLGLL